MANIKSVGKRSLIDKANSTMVIAIAVAGFVVVFSLVASKALLSQRSYQGRVIAAKKTALTQLEANVEAVKNLEVSYKAFVNTSDNVIGGNPTGSGDRDGDNAKIVLDALPSKYDFPAFVTSIQKLLKTKGITATSIGGTDDEVSQGASTASTTPVEIPLALETELGSYTNVQDFLLTLQRSIRPIRINTLDITGSEKSIQVSVDSVSYYLPKKTLTIEKKVVQ